MAVRIYRPRTSALRHTSVVNFRASLTKGVRPPKRLRAAWKQSGGRNNQGRITVRHRGGNLRRVLRLVDFRQEKRDIPAIVKTVEYDPLRSAFLARVAYSDGEQRYILAWEGVRVGQKIISSETSEPQVGNRMPLRAIPVGSEIFNVELKPGRGGKIARSAGSALILQEVEGGMAHVKMPSGEIRLLPEDVWATIGKPSNADHRTVRYGSAGRMRRFGIRPSVRGKAMNPVDHPHGGGEGHNPIGMKYPKTPWGKHALGVKTRRSKKYSQRLILQRRKK